MAFKGENHRGEEVQGKVPSELSAQSAFSPYNLAFKGKNHRGEDVYGTACGGRCVMRDGKVLSELSAQPAYNPYNLLSDDRFRTVLEAVEAVRRENDTGIDGVGASAALTAMMSHWGGHLEEGHEPAIVVRDLEELRQRISLIITDLQTTLHLPDSSK